MRSVKGFVFVAATTLSLMTGSAAADGFNTDVAPHQWIPGASPEPQKGAGHPLTKEDLETFLDGVMADQLKWQHLAGMTISVVKDGKLLLAKGYGYADVEAQKPVVAEDTLFRPGSTSKLFTWTALMQQVEQGKVDLDADVNKYIKFQIPEKFGGPITVRNLLTHTEGLEDSGFGIVVKKPEKLEPLNKFLAEHMPNRVRPALTDFNGGTQASYSNWGAALAGLIVENVSGVPFDEYIERNIYAPLGMDSSTFREPLPANLAPRMSNGYVFANGAFKKKDFELFHNIAPAGCMSSTSTDMAKFMIAHLQNGEYNGQRILKEETAKLMHKRSLGLNPMISGSALGFYETYVNGYRMISHGGDTGYFHSDMQLLVDENVGIFMSYNTLPSAHIPMRSSVLHAFMDRYFPAKLPQVKAPDDFKSRVARYAGTYSFNRHNYTRIEKVINLFGAVKVVPTDKNTLIVSFGGVEPSTQWVEVKPDVFRELDGDQMIAFAGDENGQAQYIENPLGVPFIGAYRLKWYQNPTLHQLILGFGALCFLIAIGSALRHWRADGQATDGTRMARRTAALNGLLNLAFVAILVVAVSSMEDDGFEWTGTIKLALTLALIAIPFTLGTLYFAARVWRVEPWTRWRRFQYYVIAIMGALVLWSLNFWNLIGYKFT
ncbi:MAG TPA: serine hydrolase domain-containing protein [Nevskiaceae bacterium]|nr:serine hydrolase domain-containing protein [Nevskiaceae bacterium]